MRRLLAALAVLLAVPVPCLGGVAPKTFRISGVAVSTRDGSPIARCRIAAFQVPANQIGAARPVPIGGVVGGVRPGAGFGGRPGPLGGARGRDGFGPGGLEATTDASGRFTLELPRAGAWRLNGTARGFRSQDYDEHEGFFSAVVLTEAEPAYEVMFRMAPESVLTGLIYDEAGEPVQSAQVTAERIPPAVPGGARLEARPTPVGAAQTDDRGRYEIGGLAPGNYRIRVQARPWYAQNGAMQLQRSAGAAPSPDASLDMIYPLTYFPGTDDASAAQTIALGAGEEREADLHLTAIPAVHLKIPRTPEATPSDPGRGRQPMQRAATITRMSDGDTGFTQAIAPTGASGTEWDFGGLSPGTYEVRLPGQSREGEIQQIEVRAGGQTVITMEQARSTVPVTLVADGEMEGSVEFVDAATGARAALISFSERRGFQRRVAPYDPPEDAHVQMLPAGTYEVYLLGDQNGAYLMGLTAKGATASGRTVTLTGAATLTLHTASRRVQVEGVAVLEGGKPAAGAMVLLVPATLGQPGDLRAVQRDETNTDGTFLIGGVIPGQYILVAIDHGWDVDWRNSATLVQYLMHGIPVDLTKNAKAQEDVVAVEP